MVTQTLPPYQTKIVCTHTFTLAPKLYLYLESKLSAERVFLRLLPPQSSYINIYKYMCSHKRAYRHLYGLKGDSPSKCAGWCDMPMCSIFN